MALDQGHHSGRESGTMKRHHYKALFEAIHNLAEKKDLSVSLLYGLSRNYQDMIPEYQAIAAGLKPYQEYQNKLDSFLQNTDTYQANAAKLREEHIKTIEDTEKFMNEELETAFYKISYREFPTGFFNTKADMDFWLPIIKD